MYSRSKILISSLFAVLLMYACKEAVPSVPYQPLHDKYEYRKEPNEDQVIADLYKDYNTNPVTQEQKDQNLLIDFLMENRIDASRTESGVYYKMYQYGQGGYLVQSQQFVARYTGYFMDGKVFDSNIDKTEPLTMRVGEMIEGWNQVLRLVSPGSKFSVFVPSHLAYGKSGIKGVIPPNSILIFDIHLLF